MRNLQSHSFNAFQVLEPFRQLPALQAGEHTASAWRAARQEYERRKQPVEQRISHKLKETLSLTILPRLAVAVESDKGSQPQQVRPKG